MGERQLSSQAREALRCLHNWIMIHGQMPSLRQLMVKMNYKSPRSPMLLMNELEDNGFIKKRQDGSYRLMKELKSEHSARTVLIPLVGSATCGYPMLAEQNIEAMIPVSTELIESSEKYFLLRASGDSMNKAGIDDKDLVLVKQQPIANNGDIIVALIDDEATIKEYNHKGDFVSLMPRSTNKKYQPIILTRNFQIQGKVVTTIPKSMLG
jgi:repressor LexA